MSTYYLRRNGTDISGPYSSAQLRNLAMNDGMTRWDSISEDAGSKWVPVMKVRGLREIFTASARPIPPNAPTETTGLTQVTVDLPPDEAHSVFAPLPFSSTPPPPPLEDAPRSRSPSPPVGLVDRVLRTAFRFARSISVLVILVCGLVLVGSGIGALYAIAPYQDPDQTFPVPTPEAEIAPADPYDVKLPSADAFIALCSAPKRPTPAPSRSPSKPQLGENEDEPDLCAQYWDSISIVMRELQLSEESRQPLCNTTLKFAPRFREPFTRAFADFAQEFVRNRPTEVECNPVDAANYFIQEFKLKVDGLEREQAEQERDRLARMEAAIEERNARIAAAQLDLAKRQGLLFPSILAAGASIAALLIFLVLPLLIQIERNTRDQPDAV